MKLREEEQAGAARGQLRLAPFAARNDSQD